MPIKKRCACDCNDEMLRLIDLDNMTSLINAVSYFDEKESDT